MKPVLVLRHGADIPLGLLGNALHEAGVPVREVALHAGDEVPPIEGHPGLVVLGGEMGVYDESDHPWLRHEKSLIEQAHGAGVPMLGICLGSQLFAEALGGAAYLADGPPEIGYITPELTAEGVRDPVLRHFDRPVVVFHQDTWDPPPDAIVLARTDRFPHAFRMGSAVAIQAHPEADAGIVQAWVSHDRARRMLREADVDADALVAAVAQVEDVHL